MALSVNNSPTAPMTTTNHHQAMNIALPPVPPSRPVITGLKITQFSGNALLFKDHTTALRFAEAISLRYGHCAVIQHGPPKYPALLRYSVMTSRGEVAHPRTNDDQPIIITRNGKEVWNLTATYL